MSQQRIYELIARHLSGEATEAELKELQDHLQEHGGDLLRAVVLVPDADAQVAVRSLHDLVRHELPGVLHLGGVELAPDQPLDGVDGVAGIGDRLAAGDLAHQLLAPLGERHDRRGGARPLLVRDDRRRPAVHDRHAAVGAPGVRS